MTCTSQRSCKAPRLKMRRVTNDLPNVVKMSEWARYDATSRRPEFGDQKEGRASHKAGDAGASAERGAGRGSAGRAQLSRGGCKVEARTCEAAAGRDWRRGAHGQDQAGAGKLALTKRHLRAARMQRRGLRCRCGCGCGCRLQRHSVALEVIVT